MTETESLELLKYHGYNHEDLENIKTKQGFLGMLRPFQGSLYEKNFHEVMSILRTLSYHFRDSHINRQVISSFWSICYFTRSWALDEGGMLRRNKLLSNEQIEQLSSWIDCISATINNLLNDIDVDQAFESYELYLKKG
ncbi:hypothetical protein QTN47_09325 [Danxiaibacter flavus]|uniref:Uncharacterized protein n=1 Tax=Danxiaibacter flavus TaxID=3049108 RepID=A0ABV3ZCT2_9BACT|nr:hypothetical protein QNM32_09325 [Chitinophagaceae bacterium DXS]